MKTVETSETGLLTVPHNLDPIELLYYSLGVGKSEKPIQLSKAYLIYLGSLAIEVKVERQRCGSGCFPN